MTRQVVGLIGCAALYGFSAGCVHSLTVGLRNVVKFPLLLLATAGVCAVAYHVVARSFGARVSFAALQRLSLSLFRDTATLLASFSTVTLFMATTIERPDARGLHEYPLFLGLNVVLVAGCGASALVRQSGAVLATAGLSRAGSRLLVAAWLGLSLLVGSQAAWFLRPFYGVTTATTPFLLGASPDFRGATNFYEAVWHVLSPPP